MPPQRTRSFNAQGRQKSCSECAKSKRRCDLQQPHCIRCTRQKLTCSYPPQPHASVTTPISPGDTPIDNESTNDVCTSFVFDLDAPSISTAPESYLDLDFCETINAFGASNMLLNCDGTTRVEGPSPRSGALERLPPICPNLMLSPLAESRMGYTLERLKEVPRMMVEQNATYWCHPKLYDEYMPRPLQDAYAACALFISRNEKNSTFIARHITERVQILIDQPLPTPPIELLARAHALLLYLIIFVSSEDMRYYGRAETLIPEMDICVNSFIAMLVSEEDPVGRLPLYPIAEARVAWNSYIFRETCRRTLLVLLQSVAIYHLMCGRIRVCRTDLAVGNLVTISAALWEATSPVDFAIAWNQKKHVIVKELDFEEVLRESDADNIDVFGRMMMVGMMGADDVRGWLHTRGGQL